MVEDFSCVLEVTKIGQTSVCKDRPAAYKWADKMLKEILAEADTAMEGDLKTVIPIGQSLLGFKYKFIFEGTPDSLMRDVLVAGMEEKHQCAVKRIHKDVADLQRRESEARMHAIRKRVAALSNLECIQEKVAELIALRGNVALRKRGNKFSEQGLGVISTSTRVAACNLRKNQEERQDKDE